ncbi:MAG: DUF3791 domain-containing protein [Bacteroides sp.]|nr:DUF3791 domain-containing protein [Eubacterium sp.]MCM1418519.1 DUF3791 domain-containing protein [Roseburia sp.]MCM1462600.1 DUF3791 domain-containing protein [Bacteroides sp.]
MSQEGNFLVYCMERYRYAKKLSGAEVSRLFEEYDVYDYIMDFFGSLHTMGEKLIIRDIDRYISGKRAGL